MKLKWHINKFVIIKAVLLVIIFSSVSCMTVSDNYDISENRVKNSSSPTPVYYGQGSGSTSINAMQAAKKDAVGKAAVDLLGNAAASGQKAEITVLLDSINDFDPFVLKTDMETIDSKGGDGFYYYLGLRINLSSLAAKLKSSDILGGQIDGLDGNEYSLPDQPTPVVKSDNPADVSVSSNAGKVEDEPIITKIPETSAEELAIISEYIDSLTYMVYFDENVEADPFLTRTATAAATRYLDENGYEYVDLSQIERIKEDQAMVYEEETGNAVSIIQWIAHKLNADIYIELSLDTNSRTDNGKYYGSAVLNLNSYSASTAEGRGSAVYQTIPPAFSRVSEQDALSNAVASAVSMGMVQAVAAAEKETVRAVSRGFKYTLTMHNTGDALVMREFEKKLNSRVKGLKRLSYSPEESLFEVYLIGDVSMLEDVIYDTAETIRALDGLMLVMQRGNTIIFDTGM